MELGRYNKLKVLRKSDLGYMLTDGADEILMHFKQSKKEHEDGEELDVFIYTDDKKRPTGTEQDVLVTLDKANFVKVVNKIEGSGIFVDINCPKDIFISKDYLPISEAKWPEVGDYIFVRLKIKKDVLDLHTDDNKILTFGDIRYRNYKAMSGYITFDNALLAKTADWRYECEGRLIYISNNTEEFRDGRGNIIEYTPLDGFKIEAVYLGTRINKVHEKIVFDAAKSINVPVYKMIFNLNNLTDLQPYLLG